MAQRQSGPEPQKAGGKGKMTVQEAGHLGGEKGGRKGGQRVQELVDEGKRAETHESGARKGGGTKPRH
ncbi:Em GEA1 (EM1) [Methylocystis parvus]|uniref:Em GEA1 (EM1) n=1 Tax=Methylocystis parvus TaxID=134 RepID=A0A6B8M2P8_9HYPH|nr:Em GEA1 (EM1) [Methylocystis parvus]